MSYYLALACKNNTLHFWIFFIKNGRIMPYDEVSVTKLFYIPVSGHFVWSFDVLYTFYVVFYRCNKWIAKIAKNFQKSFSDTFYLTHSTRYIRILQNVVLWEISPCRTIKITISLLGSFVFVFYCCCECVCVKILHYGSSMSHTHTHTHT